MKTLVENLRDLVPVGARVFTLVVRYSESSRWVRLFVIQPGEGSEGAAIREISLLYGALLGQDRERVRRNGVRVRGTGFDAGQHLVTDLSLTLYETISALRHDRL